MKNTNIPAIPRKHRIYELLGAVIIVVSMNFESFMPREFRAHAPCSSLKGTQSELGSLGRGYNAG